MKETEKAWLASAVDGEGSIVLRSGGVITITVANTCEAYCRHAADLMGGKCYPLKGKHGIIYQAQLALRFQVKEVLDAILPYLIIKREKAQAILNWIEEHPYLSPEENSQRISEGKQRKNHPNLLYGFEEEFI